MQLDDLSLFLFLPANRLDRLDKAATSGADAVILDLEDAVAPDAKTKARDGLRGALDDAAANKPVLVRINSAGTDWYAGDVTAVRDLPVCAVMLPKAESAEQCEQLASQCGKPVIALIETAKGVLNAASIAQCAARLAFGNLDYASDLGVEQNRAALALARSTLVLVSRVAGIAAPIDGVMKAFDDPAAVEDDTAYGRSMGFSGKLLIHPKQIEPARRALQPAANEVEWAQRVLDAVGDDDTGLSTLNGQMIDAPVIKRARQILARHAPGAERSI